MNNATSTSTSFLRNLFGRGVTAETEFLPAALEIVASPPSPLPRIVLISIITFVMIAFAWSWFGWVDIIATAPGRVIPSGRIKVIQPFEIGTIRAIHVDEGQRVKAGELLIELDATTNQADADRIADQLTRAQIDVMRLNSELDTSYTADFNSFNSVDQKIVSTAISQKLADEEEQNAKLKAIDSKLAEKQAAISQVLAAIERLKSVLPLVEERITIRQTGVQTGFGSKIALLESEQMLLEMRSELIVQQRRLDENVEASTSLKHQREQTLAEYRRRLLTDLAKAESQANSLAQDLRKASERAALQQLKAPVNGTVQQLAVHTVGGVVTPAQQLMVIVPSNAQLEIEAMIQNRDIGFILPNQPVEIKIETFNFARYGLLKGTVTRISRDAISIDKPDPRATNSQPRSQLGDASNDSGSGYIANVALERSSMHIGDTDISLEPGMAVTVEIKTGERRVIEYMLSPIQRYKHDSLRER